MYGFVPDAFLGTTAPRSGQVTKGAAPRTLYSQQRYLAATERYQVVVPCYGKNNGYITSTEAGSADPDEWTVAQPPYTAWTGWGVMACATGTGVGTVSITRTMVDHVANTGDLCGVGVNSSAIDWFPANSTSDSTDAWCKAHEFETNNVGTDNDPTDGEWHHLTFSVEIADARVSAVVFIFDRLTGDVDV